MFSPCQHTYLLHTYQISQKKSLWKKVANEYAWIMIRLGQLRGRVNCRICFHQFFKYVWIWSWKRQGLLKYWTLFLLRERGKWGPLCCSGFHTSSSLRKETETFPSGLGISLSCYFYWLFRVKPRRGLEEWRCSVGFLRRDYWGWVLNEEGKGLSGRKTYNWKRPILGSRGQGKLFHPSNSSPLLLAAMKSVSFAS